MVHHKEEDIVKINAVIFTGLIFIYLFIFLSTVLVLPSFIPSFFPLILEEASQA